MERLILWVCIICLCVNISCYTGALNKASGTYQNQIVYKQASEVLNDSSMVLLRELILEKNYATNSLLNKPVICGPFLWNKIKDLEQFQNTKGAILTLLVDDTQLDGKVLWDNNVHDLLEYSFKNINKDSLIIRKLNQSEINAYWTYISFDIEEPIYIVETGKKKYVVDMKADNLGLFWFDDFSSIGREASEITHDIIEPITELNFSVGIFDLSFNIRRDLPDSVFVLIPFIGGNLFFIDRPSSNVLELMVLQNKTVNLILDTTVFNEKYRPNSKDELFEELGLNIIPNETKFGRFGSYFGRAQNGKIDDFGEMVMFWDNLKRDGFLLCFFDRPCKVEGYIAQKKIVIDIKIPKPGFYCIGNEPLPEGKTLMKEVNPPSEAYYFVGISREKQNW